MCGERPAYVGVQYSAMMREGTRQTAHSKIFKTTGTCQLVITSNVDTDYEATAIEVYDHDGSDLINDWLRSDECDEDQPVDSYREHKGLSAWETDQATKINRLDEAVARNEATNPVTLWRGLNPKSTLWKVAELEAGDVISDPAFLSTTTKETYARGYADEGGYTLKIEAASGATMLKVFDHLVNHGDHVILPRRAELLVQDIGHETNTITVSYE